MNDNGVNASEIKSYVAKLLKDGDASGALVALERFENAFGDLDAAILCLKGNVLWRLGRQGEAMSCYVKADALKPGGEAAVRLENARAVMAFYNKDLLNP